MNLLLSAEEEEVASAAALLLQRARTMSVGSHPTPDAHLNTLWNLVGDAGWFGLGVSVEEGGAGGGIGELVALFREVGRSLVADPILGTVVAAQVAAELGERDLLENLLSGQYQLALAWPDASEHVANRMEGRYVGPWQVSGAHHGGGLLVVSRSWTGILLGNIHERTPIDGIDPSFVRERVAGDFTVAAIYEGAKFFWRIVTLLAATLVGVGESSRDLSVEYAKDRQQFGEPIGAFQAVKHRCADMAVRSESAWSLTCYAAASLEGDQQLARLYASSAKVIAGRCAIQNAIDNVQNHGAMGFTDELGAHLLLRRAHALDDTLIASAELLDLLRRS